MCRFFVKKETTTTTTTTIIIIAAKVAKAKATMTTMTMLTMNAKRKNGYITLGKRNRASVGWCKKTNVYIHEVKERAHTEHLCNSNHIWFSICPISSNKNPRNASVKAKIYRIKAVLSSGCRRDSLEIRLLFGSAMAHSYTARINVKCECDKEWMHEWKRDRIIENIWCIRIRLCLCLCFVLTAICCSFSLSA